MQFYVGDFLGSTASWSGEERALFALALIVQWAAPPLPRDPAKLALALSYELQPFLKIWSLVSGMFSATRGGLLNLRLERHRQEASDLSLARSVSGRKGGRSRKQLDEQAGSNKGAKAKAKGKANAKQTSTYPHPHPKAQSQPKLDAKTQNQKHVFDAGSVPGLDLGTWERWRQYHKDLGKPIRAPSLEAAAKKLAKFERRQAEVVETSIANGWLRLFEPEAATKGGSNGSTDPEASLRFDALIASDGAGRTKVDQEALDGIGGWSVIRLRTPSSEPHIRRNFCRAYQAAKAKAQPCIPAPETLS
jgi:uncharacterized protein YdaU (DUF1376 family)